MKIDSLVSIAEYPITHDLVKFIKIVGRWCQLPYPGHKHGCPNYNKSPTCPPHAPHYEETIYQFKNLKLIVAQFDFATYKDRMRELNPERTEKQIACVLYWQSQIKRMLKKYINNLHPHLILGCGSGLGSYSMEAVGINVIHTLKNIGLNIEVKPVNIIHLVCLIGYRKRTVLEMLQ